MQKIGLLKGKYQRLRNTAFKGAVFSVFYAGLAINSTASAGKFESPKILMLGDSQLSFGAGEVVVDFFQNLKANCEGIIDQKMLLEELQKMRTTLIGARSSSLQSWTTTDGWAYDRLCKKDKTWGVNASIWGHGRTEGVPYVQIGEHKDYKFCERGKTPMQVLLKQGYNPDLLIFNILGNNAKRWANDPKLADVDVARFIKQTPAHIKCIYMTTLPIYTKRRNTQRFKAQKAIKAAFERAGNRCSFVGTLDKKTISLIQGQSKYFKRKKSGKVKDPFHPQKSAAKKVYNLKRKEICKAIEQAYMPKVLAISDLPIVIPVAIPTQRSSALFDSSSTLEQKMESIPSRTSKTITVKFDSQLRGRIQ